MITFIQRKRLATQFEKWCKENSVLCCATSMVSFLQGNGLLNEDTVREYLKAETDSKEPLAGLQEFKV